MTDNIATEQLRLHIEAIENLNDEIKGLSDDRKDRYALAKGEGFDTKTLKAVIQRRAIEKAAREEADALLETYEAALA
jgi:uncharacterized protein (UPF0335 family)